MRAAGVDEDFVVASEHVVEGGVVLVIGALVLARRTGVIFVATQTMGMAIIPGDAGGASERGGRGGDGRRCSASGRRNNGGADGGVGGVETAGLCG